MRQLRGIQPSRGDTSASTVTSHHQTALSGHGKGDTLITPTRTSLAIAIAFATAAVAVPTTAAAGEPKNGVPFVAVDAPVPAAGESKSSVPFVAARRPRVTHPTPVERIIAQERGRRGDPLVFGLPEQAPVRILQRHSGFDWAVAGIGGAATLALVLLAALGAALWHESRRQGAPA